MKGHKWFASFYDRMSESEEKKFMGAVRSELLRGVTGDVLEIGAGTGLNFGHYDSTARVIATEPDPYMMDRAEARTAGARAGVTLVRAGAEALPFADDRFDFAISTLVLCSVDDPAASLAEVRRVLKPGGELRVFEHVRYDSALGALGQDLVAPTWRWLGAGCNPNRDTARSIREAGFELIRSDVRKEFLPIPPRLFVRPHLTAVARRGLTRPG